MLTVACVLKRSQVYDNEYVTRLKDGVMQHITVPHRFVCLSDMMAPCHWVQLTWDWPGWWAKMELFKLDPPVLYFDLDTIITGDLTDIAKAAEEKPFIILRDFYRETGMQSALMSWSTDQSALYRRFALKSYDYIKQYGMRGDQAFLEDHLKPEPAKWQDVVPGQVCSYKVHVQRAAGAPKDCRVVCFHGRPKPRDIGWSL